MSDTYHYRSLLQSVEYRLTDDGVAIAERKLGRFTRVLVPFDEIPVRSSTVTWSSRPLLWTAVVSGVLFFVVTIRRFFVEDPEPDAAFFYGGLCLIALGLLAATRKTSDVFLFQGDTSLAFHRRKLSDSSLAGFLDAMQSRKLDFLERRVALRAAETSGDEVARYLLYLRESGLVDENGYARLRTFLAGVNSSSSIGFN